MEEQKGSVYQTLLGLLEQVHGAVAPPPTVAGSLGLMMSALPAGRAAMAPRGNAPRSFGPRELEPPPPLEPLDIKGMNLPNTGTRPGFDSAAFQRAEDLRRGLGVEARTEGGRSTDAALKAIEEALKLVPPQFRR